MTRLITLADPQSPPSARPTKIARALWSADQTQAAMQTESLQFRQALLDLAHLACLP
jgi:hypothetical protein